MFAILSSLHLLALCDKYRKMLLGGGRRLAKGDESSAGAAPGYDHVTYAGDGGPSERSGFKVFFCAVGAWFERPV